jgi:hypothetical protein
VSSLDHPIGGFTLTKVSQQPMIDLLSDMDSQRLAIPLNQATTR